MEAFGVDGPSDSNVNVNIFWTNSPTKGHEFLKIAVEEKCSIATFRKKVVKLIMNMDKFQYDEQKIDEEDNFYYMIEMMTNRGHLLFANDDCLTVGDFKDDGQNQELCVIVQTNTFGLIHFALNSFDSSSLSLFWPFNLRLDTFGTLKSRIREFAKMSQENSFRFIYGSKYLDIDKEEHDDRPILGLPTNIYYYEHPPSAPFSVYVVNVPGGMLGIRENIRPGSTIEELKHLIEKSRGIPPDLQRIIFDGRHLWEGFRTLKDYNVEDGSILLMVPRNSGGGGGPSTVGAVSIPGISFADLSDSRNLVQRAFTSEAPDWRIVKEGLNIEGICRHTACKAYNQQVIASRGFEDFHLKSDSWVSCRICGRPMKELRTCGFVSTFWRYFGRKGINPSELLNSDWAEAGDDAYTTFDVNKPDGGLKGMESWSLLVIQARPIFKDKSGKYPQPSHCGFCFQRTEHTELKRLSCGHVYHEKCTEKSHFRCNLCVFNIH